MKKLLFLSCFAPFCLLAQQLPNVIPPSPLTQELNKYIDFPVDYNTGIPEISIPLYTIKTNGLEIPITLNYHASGIKYGQDDGDVGLGWSLSCNYRVSRTIYGHPDRQDVQMNSSYQNEIQTLTSNITFPHDLPITNPQVLYPQLNRDKFLKRFIANYNVDNGSPSPSGIPLDGEYDHFNYSIVNGGGKFIISNRDNKTISEFNSSNNKFDYLEGTASNKSTSGIIGFSIKDDNQNKYSYGEQIDKLGFQVLETPVAALDLRNATAWALTDIETKFGEKIKFSYKNKVRSSKYKRRANLNIIEAVQNIFLWEHQFDDEGTSNNYSVFGLQSIKTDNERIEFLDSNTRNQIHQINIRDSLTNELVKRIEFYYHDLNFTMHGYVLLDSIKIFDKDLVEFQKHSFDYYDLQTDYLVPDQYGYIKTVLANDAHKVLHSELGNDHARKDGFEASSNRISGKVSDSYAGNLGNRIENGAPEQLSLKSITYPTGGFTVYEYEPSGGETVNIGGIRIKSISHLEGKVNHPNVPILKLKRNYTYGGASIGSHLNHNDFRKEYMIFQDYDGSTIARRAVNYSSDYFGDRTDFENAKYYSHVTESIVSNQGYNGKTVYQYTNTYIPANLFPLNIDVNDDNGYFQYYQNRPLFILNYERWRKPLLSSKKIYNNENKLLKEQSYLYQSNYQAFSGLKVKPFAQLRDQFFNEYFPSYYAFVSSIYSHGLYTLETGKSLLFSKKETIFSGSDSLTTNTSYQYNALDQVIKETTADSRGHVVETQTVFPANFPHNYNNMRMLQANDVNKILEQSVHRNNVLVSLVKNEFLELPGEIFVPDNIKRYNPDTQSNEKVLVFHNYDDLGNVQSLSLTNNTIVNYIWSYKGKLPIAEIKGTDYQTIENTLGTGAIALFKLKSSPNQSEIELFLEPLRSAIENGTIKDAELVSYSYDPLKGIKSQTDPRGKSIYYEYDKFGRLKLIKDDNGAIQKKIDYHYRNH